MADNTAVDERYDTSEYRKAARLGLNIRGEGK